MVVNNLLQAITFDQNYLTFKILRMKKLLYHFAAIGFFSISLLATGCSGNSDGSKNSTTSSSENDKKIEDNELKSFMLGGIYFVRGYGGKAPFDQMITSRGKDAKDIVSSGRELLILPFKPSDGGDPKGMLRSMWDINSKDDLIKTLDMLKNHKMESSYTKSWDYARYVNNVCMAYAGGYVTEDESKKLVADILPLAQQDYKNWNDYFTDFAVGRNKWDSEASQDKTMFDELSKTITQGDNNIYTILPLH